MSYTLSKKILKAIVNSDVFICGSYVCFLCHDLELQTGSFDKEAG